jgi:hypothetical protein
MITDETRDRAQRLRERVDADYADAWDFKELPLLVGVVESYARVETVHGPRVVCTIVEAESERRYAVWLSQTALLRRFQELRPAIGELIAIRYLGVSDQPPKPGQSPPHRFRVEVDRPGESFDWSRLEADDNVIPSTAPAATRLSPADDDIPF